MKRRMRFVLLALCMIVLLMPMPVHAADGTANFNITNEGESSSLLYSAAKTAYTVGNGTVTVSIDGTLKTDANASYTNVSLESAIVITLTADTDYTGTLRFNGSDVATEYLVTSGTESKYSFKLSQLGFVNGDAKALSVRFSSQNPGPQDPTDVAIPANSIQINITEFLGNSLSYYAAHTKTDIALTMQYSYDNTVWNELSNFGTDEDFVQAYDSAVNNGTYTYAFINHNTVYLKITGLISTGTIQSLALNPKTDDNIYTYAGDLSLNSVYALNVKNKSYDLTFANGTFTLIWDYLTDVASMRVENGTAKVIKINGLDAASDPACEYGNTNKGGYWMLQKGDIITIELKPNYGYQFLGGGFNDDQNLTSTDTVSTFTFTMPGRNLHLHALFKKTDNKVTNTSAKVDTGGIVISNTEIDSGAVDLSISDIALAADKITDFKNAAGNYNISTYLNISLEQFVNKGSADSAWTTPMENLTNPATVTLKLEEGVNGNEVVIVHEKSAGIFEVIPTTFDAATKTISFSTNSFSNYAIASRTVAKSTATASSSSASNGYTVPNTADRSK